MLPPSVCMYLDEYVPSKSHIQNKFPSLLSWFSVGILSALVCRKEELVKFSNCLIDLLDV